MSLKASQTAVPPGGGAFTLTRVTLGVFLTDQPEHRYSADGHATRPTPLARDQGWILPAGSDGLCLFERGLDLLTVELDGTLLTEAGLRDPTDFRAYAGAFDPVLLSLAKAAPAFPTGGTLYRETMERALAAQLVQTLAPAEPVRAALSDARLARVVEYLQENLAEDLSLSAMASIAAMSQTHFAKAFKAATGSSPLQYVIAARLDRAAALLHSTRLPVSDIAWRVGYGDLSRFSQHFKRRFGTTPGKYRA